MEIEVVEEDLAVAVVVTEAVEEVFPEVEDEVSFIPLRASISSAMKN